MSNFEIAFKIFCLIGMAICLLKIIYEAIRIFFLDK